MTTSEADLNNELNEIFNCSELSGFLTKKIPKLNKNAKKTKLVLSGGGIKGFSLLGSLYALEKLDLIKHVKTYAGSSIGACTSVLMSIGYKADELMEILKMVDFRKMTSVDLSNLLTQYGLDDGKRFEMVIRKLISAKNIDPDITFKEMYEMTDKTVIITATCVNDKKVYYFSHKTAPEMPVITAIRMSISIPIYFVPVTYKGKMYIDGGCMDNYPMQLFSDDLDDVIGIHLNDVKSPIDEIKNIEDYMYHTLQCLLEGMTCNSMKEYEKYTVKIDVTGSNSVNFVVNEEEKQKLFDQGFDAVMNRFE